jgi:hypothetical protein
LTQLGPHGWKLVKICVPCGNLPVKRLAREATQTGEVAKHWVNAVPSRTSRSSWGVRIQLAPNAAIVSARCWSVIMRMMLGRLMNGRFQLTAMPALRHDVFPLLEFALLESQKAVGSLDMDLVALRTELLPERRIARGSCNGCGEAVNNLSRRSGGREQPKPCGGDDVVAGFLQPRNAGDHLRA